MDRKKYLSNYMKRYRKYGPIKGYGPQEYVFESDPRKRKRILQATPSWADLDRIREIYMKKDKFEQQYGIKFVVKHIIPISHPRVCGLHVLENLEIVSESRAAQLGRKFMER